VKEIFGDIWNYHELGYWIVITTNGTIKNSGECVMGKGIAKEAKTRFWNLASWLGWKVGTCGNHCFVYTFQRRQEDKFVLGGLITFPTKQNWWERSDPYLIEKSCQELVKLVDEEQISEIYMVRPGCKNGRLDWKDVKPILEKYLDDRFIVVEIND